MSVIGPEGATPVVVGTTRGPWQLGGRVRLMGIVNATPDSFSDGGVQRSLAERVALAEAQLAAGAELIDIGGESGVTNRPAVDAEEEIKRVVPLIKEVAGELGALVSVDTYKPAVARAAIEAGAAIVNDVSALRDPALADVCAETGAGLVLMHTRAAPKVKLLDRAYDETIVEDVRSLLGELIALACSRGVDPDQLILDPGPDFAKTPFQTVQVMRAVDELHSFGRPLLLAISRKDFIGAVTGRPPSERLAGTLAALAHGAASGGHIVRIHDVAAARDFLDVLDVLEGRLSLDPEASLADGIRWERQG
jgi:dihydropteroate synthase